MKRIFIFTICISAFGVFNPAYANTSKIDNECKIIQKNIGSLEVNTVNISGRSSEGGEAKYYRDNGGSIRLLVVNLYFESGRMIEKFYFKDNSIIFANSQYFRYNVPFYVTPELAKEIGSESFDPEKTKFSEEKFYFDQAKMVQWSNEESEAIAPNSQKFKVKAQEILKEISALLNKET